MTALVVAESAVLAILAVMVVGLLRSHAEILRRLHEIEDASAPAAGRTPAGGFAVNDAIPGPRENDGDFPPAADIGGAGMNDDALTVSVTAARGPILLAFLSSSCMTCRPFWDAFSAPASLGLPPGTRPVVVSRDRDEESMSRLEDLATGIETLVLSSQAWHDYAVPGSPYFVWVVGGAVRGEGTGVTWDQVRTLLSDSAQARRGDETMEARIDAELNAAGIGPGDPSLSPQAHTPGAEQ